MVRALIVAAVVAAAGGAWRGAEASGDSPVQRLTIRSQAVGRTEHVSVVVPPGGGAGRFLLVFLHGRGGDERSSLNTAFFAAWKRLGADAPVVAFPDGGTSSYWHDRGSGRWGRYVMREVIPRALAASGADGTRIAIAGISMGGFGAYDLARLHRGRFCSVSGHSPALWTSSGQTAPGAFDDAADFRRHDVIRAARNGVFKGMPLWLDAGTRDPFRPGHAAFAAAAAAAHTKLVRRTWPGGHDGAYWNAHWRSYLRFAVSSCA
jgi:S-formylglutathione hydrolase FrmB